VFVSGKGADNTAILGIAIGVSILCIAAIVIVIAVPIYRHKVKNRYMMFHEFGQDYVAMS